MNRRIQFRLSLRSTTVVMLCCVRFLDLSLAPAARAEPPEADLAIAGDLEPCVAAIREANPELAIEQCNPLAEDGDVTAQALVATLHLGTSVYDPAYYDWRDRLREHGEHEVGAIDFRSALSAWETRAEAGDAYAQLAMSWLLMSRPGDDADNWRDASPWLRRSADQGNSMAQYSIGAVYEEGQGIRKSLKKALKWYRLAAERRNGQAALAIGLMYEFGYEFGIPGITKGVPRNYEEAARWYRIAAANGSREGEFRVGHMLDEGRGMERDYVEAMRWYLLAAAHGSVDAANNIGGLYWWGQGVPEDKVLAYQWYSLAVYHETRLDPSATGPDNLELAAKPITADQRKAAKLRLARLCEDGKEVPRDDAQAWFWYELALRQRDKPPVAESTVDDAAAAARQAAIAARLRPATLARLQQRARDWVHP